MKIAIINPPWITLPPYGYGGREKVVYDIVEGMVKKGHDVTLFATGDCKVSSKLDFYYPKALGNNSDIKQNPYNILNHLHYSLKKVEGKFDLIHFHLSGITLYFASFVKTPFLFTLHGAYFKNQEKDQFGSIESGRNGLIQFKDYPYVTISNNQREGIVELNYIKTIYNCITLSEFNFSENGSGDMVWLGRVTYTKGVDLAIEVAKKTKKQLNLACFVDLADKGYFEQKIKPQLDPQLTKVYAEVKEKNEKSDYLGNAKVFLMPIRWNEPFGIVMIEAMACGTPVIAFANGSVPEVVKDGETGFIVNFSEENKRGNWIVKKTGIEGLQEAVEKIYSMPEDQYRQMRKNCRAHVEKNFTVDRMVNEYEKVFQQLVENG